MDDTRNVMVHEYFGADPSILWRTVTSDIPALIEALRRTLVILESEPTS